MKSPFKFLDSYTLADREIFFGRDQEITELYRRVFESKMLLVYGISGTGKSSLINCGLASRFDDSDWLPVNVRRGNNIIESLNEACDKQALTPLKKDISFTEKLQSIYLDHFKPIFLIFDQFEELFIFGSEEEKIRFKKQINEIIGSNAQCRVIFVIREEFLAGITELESDLHDIFSNRFRVEKMKRANAISAIEGPCKVNGIETEAGFSEEIIKKLCQSGNEIELTFLQIYLDKIFRLAISEKHLLKNDSHKNSEIYPSTNGGEEARVQFSKELLSEAGSVSDLLGQFLKEKVREFEDPETGMSILKSFVSVQGTKKQMTEHDIFDSIGTFGKEISEEDLIKLLEKFVDLRILRERDESGYFELRHDALAAKIYEEFTISEKELLEVRMFLENALIAFKSRGTYLNHDDLEYLAPYEKRLFLSPVLREFVSESKEKLHSQQRALRRLTSIVAVLFLIIVGAGVKYYVNQKGFSRTKELTTLALLQEKVDPLRSISTAYKIRQKDSISTVIQGIILNSFNTLVNNDLEKFDKTIPGEFYPHSITVNGSVLSMHMNKGGNHLYGWTDKKEVFIYKTGDTDVRSFIADNDILTVEMSPGAMYLAVIYRNGMGEVYDGSGKKLFAFETTVNHLMNDRLVRFFPAGKFFMAAVKDSGAVIYDSAGTDLFNLVGHKGRVNSLDISPDGRFVVTASCDKSAIIWNYNYRNQKFSPYDTLAKYKDKFSGYGKPDSIIGPTDTIWSCEFSHSGKYILTASADSLINIWSLNGSLRNEFFIAAENSVHGAINFWPLWGMTSPLSAGTYESDGTYSYIEGYYKKTCNATFTAGEKAIIASNYSYDEGTHNSSGGLFQTKVVYFDGRSVYFGNRVILENSFIKLEQNQTASQEIQTIRLFDISSDCQYFALVPYQKNNIHIIALDGYRLAELQGSYPVFSNDGKSLYFIHENSIRCLSLDLKKIYKIVIDQKLFGNPESAENIWKIL